METEFPETEPFEPTEPEGNGENQPETPGREPTQEPDLPDEPFPEEPSPN
jgi:hypothetical protein